MIAWFRIVHIEFRSCFCGGICINGKCSRISLVRRRICCSWSFKYFANDFSQFPNRACKSGSEKFNEKHHINLSLSRSFQAFQKLFSSIWDSSSLIFHARHQNLQQSSISFMGRSQRAIFVAPSTTTRPNYVWIFDHIKAWANGGNKNESLCVFCSHPISSTNQLVRLLQASHNWIIYKFQNEKKTNIYEKNFCGAATMKSQWRHTSDKSWLEKTAT